MQLLLVYFYFKIMEIPQKYIFYLSDFVKIMSTLTKPNHTKEEPCQKVGRIFRQAGDPHLTDNARSIKIYFNDLFFNFKNFKYVRIWGDSYKG